MTNAKERRRTTKRLALRHFVETDWEGFHDYWSAPEVTRHLLVPAQSVAQTKAKLQILLPLPKTTVQGVSPLAIALGNSDFMSRNKTNAQLLTKLEFELHHAPTYMY